MLTNPFTGQTINANPRGCNQFSGPECSGYHGTNKKFKSFSRGPHQRSGGFWFNSEPGVSSMYASSKNSRLISARLKMGKKAPSDLYQKLVEYYEGSGGDIPYDHLITGAGEDANDFVKAESKALRTIRKAGYNSVEVENPEGGLDRVVLDPKQIRVKKIYKRKSY